MDHYNDIITKLITISKLTDGMTLSSSYDQVICHNSWTTSFWRTYNRETRHNTVIYIRSTFDSAINFLKTGSYEDQLTLKSYISQALDGFNHLKTTYKG